MGRQRSDKYFSDSSQKKIMKIFVLLSVFTCLALGFGQVVDIDIETIGADVSVMEYCEGKPSCHRFYRGCSALCTCGGDGSVGCVGRAPQTSLHHRRSARLSRSLTALAARSGF